MAGILSSIAAVKEEWSGDGSSITGNKGRSQNIFVFVGLRYPPASPRSHLNRRQREIDNPHSTGEKTLYQ